MSNYLSNKLARAITEPAIPHYKRSTSINPSAASVRLLDGKVVGACNRQQYYRITQEEPESGSPNPDWILSSIMGDNLHSFLCQIIDTYGFQMGLQKITAEHPIYDPRVGLSGRSDLIVWDHNTDEPVGIEIKSIGEYKCKKAVEEPIGEHVLQSVVYLDFYNKNIPEGQKKITKWYIWYLSRSENWTIKSKPHNSDLTILWDYRIELDNGVPIVKTSTFSQRWVEYSVEKIYERYQSLVDHVKTNTVPPRDYEIKYSEERIAGMHKLGELNKTNSEVVEKWIKKGAPKGKLKLEMGDGECMFCDYKRLCWEGQRTTPRVDKFSNLPEVKKEAPKIDLV